MPGSISCNEPIEEAACRSKTSQMGMQMDWGNWIVRTGSAQYWLSVGTRVSVILSVWELLVPWGSFNPMLSNWTWVNSADSANLAQRWLRWSLVRKSPKRFLMAYQEDSSFQSSLRSRANACMICCLQFKEDLFAPEMLLRSTYFGRGKGGFFGRFRSH